MAEQTNVIRKKHKNKSKFWFGFRIYAGVLVLLIVIMCFTVWNTMKKYEAAQPDKYMEKLVDKLETGDISDLQIVNNGNKFEKDLDLTEQLKEAVKGKKLTFKNASGSYDSLAPSYDIISGEEKIAKVNLKSVREYKKMAILVLSEWEVNSIEPVSAGKYNITITAPERYTVSVNGVELGKDEQAGEPVAMDGFKYVAEYVETPKSVTYVVKGLTEYPELTVNGKIVDKENISEKDGLLTYTSDFEPEEISSELSEFVLKNAKDYTNFFSKDLPGSTESTAPIAHLFPTGSYYLETAEIYRQQDMWTYSAHYSPEFRNERVFDYTVYSDDCFSVKVYFDKSMILKLNNQERIVNNNQIYYYVNIDGKWLIADMRDNL